MLKSFLLARVEFSIRLPASGISFPPRNLNLFTNLFVIYSLRFIPLAILDRVNFLRWRISFVPKLQCFLSFEYI